MYLEEEAVAANLRAVAERFEGPCLIAFDYLSREVVEEQREVTRLAGEPWVFGRGDEEMVEFVGGCGLTLVDHLSCYECLEIYLPVREDGKSVGVTASTKTLMVAANSAAQEELHVAC